jgi:hypothetical protein
MSHSGSAVGYTRVTRSCNKSSSYDSRASCAGGYQLPPEFAQLSTSPIRTMKHLQMIGKCNKQCAKDHKPFTMSSVGEIVKVKPEKAGQVFERLGKAEAVGAAALGEDKP